MGYTTLSIELLRVQEAKKYAGTAKMRTHIHECSDESIPDQDRTIYNDSVYGITVNTIHGIQR